MSKHTGLDHRCETPDGAELLARRRVGFTPHRAAVLEAIGAGGHPLTVREILAALPEEIRINRVTVYRILDLLMESGLVERLSGADRSWRYGLSPHLLTAPHAHFYCTRCGAMACLDPDEVTLRFRQDGPFPAGRIDRVEIRLDGMCADCRKKGGW